jgi:hypothetical protein
MARFFDTAPMYGAGLSEIRLGKYLAQHNRDEYVLSTKVGRLILDEIDTDERDSEMFKFGRANRVVYDYTEKGALKSIEGEGSSLGSSLLGSMLVFGSTAAAAACGRGLAVSGADLIAATGADSSPQRNTIGASKRRCGSGCTISQRRGPWWSSGLDAIGTDGAGRRLRV